MRIVGEKHSIGAAAVTVLLVITQLSGGTNSAIAQSAGALPAPVVMTAEQVSVLPARVAQNFIVATGANW